MIIKREVVGKLFLIGLFTLLFSTFVFAATGKECSTTPNSLMCGGRPISTPGYGAVELCQVCFQCGVADGVCPESYSDGVYEENSLKTVIDMRVGRGIFYGDIYSVAFHSGVEACGEIGGTCLRVERSTDGNSWMNLGLSECTRNVSLFDAYNNAYFRAVCQKVPRKAGCEYCPDPDCKNKLSGFAIDVVSKAAIDGVTIDITSPNNAALKVSPTGTSTSGVYSMDAVTGMVNISCQRAGFEPFHTLTYLNPGRNIFDCTMSKIASSCEADCHIEDGSAVDLCRAECDDVNSCQMTEQAKTLCDGRPVGEEINTDILTFVDPINGCTYENITTLTCCEGTLAIQTNGIYTPGIGCGNCFGPHCTIIPETNGSFISGDVSSIITRNFRKEYKGVPVTLKIIVYNK